MIHNQKVWFRRAFVYWLLFKGYKFVRGLFKCRVSGKAILITGCDSGFGKMLATQLSQREIFIYGGCLTKIGVRDLAQLHNPLLRPILMDVTNDDSVKNVFEQVKTELEAGNMDLWAVVNNAGVLRMGPMDCMSMQEWQLQMDVNVFGCVRVTKTFLPLLIQSQGRIINVASVAGIQATPDTSAYNASKYAVQGMSDSWRMELARWGVKVVVIEPGVMLTPLWDHGLNETQVLQNQHDKQSPYIQNKYGRNYFLAKHYATTTFVRLTGSDPQCVVDAMITAIHARYPLSRYTVGWDTYLFRLLRLLPTALSDLLIDVQMLILLKGVKPAMQNKLELLNLKSSTNTGRVEPK